MIRFLLNTRVHFHPPSLTLRRSCTGLSMSSRSLRNRPTPAALSFTPSSSSGSMLRSSFFLEKKTRMYQISCRNLRSRRSLSLSFTHGRSAFVPSLSHNGTSSAHSEPSAPCCEPHERLDGSASLWDCLLFEAGNISASSLALSDKDEFLTSRIG